MTPAPDYLAQHVDARERVRKAEAGVTNVWPRTISGRTDPSWTALADGVSVRVVADVVFVSVRAAHDATVALSADLWPTTAVHVPLDSVGTLDVATDGTLTLADTYTSGSDGLASWPFKTTVSGDGPA
jgi:hypothetical protein